MPTPPCVGPVMGLDPRFTVLVIDDDPCTAMTVAAALPRLHCEVIACPDMALAEAALEMTRFDVVLVAPRCSGVDGAESLAVADFVIERSQGALAALLLPGVDRDLAAAVKRKGSIAVLSLPLEPEALIALLNSMVEPSVLPFSTDDVVRGRRAVAAPVERA